MTTIELTNSNGIKFMYQLDTGWEIYNEGQDKPARWVNHREGRNLDSTENYTTVKSLLMGITQG